MMMHMHNVEMVHVVVLLRITVHAIAFIFQGMQTGVEHSVVGDASEWIPVEILNRHISQVCLHPQQYHRYLKIDVILYKNWISSYELRVQAINYY